jgi:hypothetical protein
VGEHEVELLSPFLAFHGGSTLFGLTELGRLSEFGLCALLERGGSDRTVKKEKRNLRCVFYGERGVITCFSVVTFTI